MHQEPNAKATGKKKSQQWLGHQLFTNQHADLSSVSFRSWNKPPVEDIISVCCLSSCGRYRTFLLKASHAYALWSFCCRPCTCTALCFNRRAVRISCVMTPDLKEARLPCWRSDAHLASPWLIFIVLQLLLSCFQGAHYFSWHHRLEITSASVVVSCQKGCKAHPA